MNNKLWKVRFVNRSGENVSIIYTSQSTVQQARTEAESLYEQENWSFEYCNIIATELNLNS